MQEQKEKKRIMKFLFWITYLYHELRLNAKKQIKY